MLHYFYYDIWFELFKVVCTTICACISFLKKLTLVMGNNKSGTVNIILGISMIKRIKL